MYFFTVTGSSVLLVKQGVLVQGGGGDCRIMRQTPLLYVYVLMCSYYLLCF